MNFVKEMKLRSDANEIHLSEMQKKLDDFKDLMKQEVQKFEGNEVKLKLQIHDLSEKLSAIFKCAKEGIKNNENNEIEAQNKLLIQCLEDIGILTLTDSTQNE